MQYQSTRKGVAAQDLAQDRAFWRDLLARRARSRGLPHTAREATGTAGSRSSVTPRGSPCIARGCRFRRWAATFPDSHVGQALRSPSDYPGGHQDSELTVEFTVLGQDFVGLNGGPAFRPNEAVSWGFSWQIVPRALMAAMKDPDRAAAKRAMQVMMTMRRIDIAGIEAARAGHPAA